MTGERYRLPSESEWEYAARAGSETMFSWGNEIGNGRPRCSGCVSGGQNNQTTPVMPVGSFPPNAFGLHDMHGSVFEWVEDCWNDRYDGAPSDGSAWLDGYCHTRVLRGGSWSYAPRFLKSAFRYRESPGRRRITYGFRVARTLDP